MWSKKYVLITGWDTVTGSTFFVREPETQHMVHLLLAAPHPFSVLPVMALSGVFARVTLTEHSETLESKASACMYWKSNKTLFIRPQLCLDALCV